MLACYAPVPCGPGRRLVLCLLVCLLVGPGPALASDLAVAPGAVEISPGDGACSLREAIMNANTDSDTSAGDCAAGSGADRIELAAGSTYTLHDVSPSTVGATGLPAITSDVTIVGNGSTIQRAGRLTAVRILYVAAGGTLKLDGVTLDTGSGPGSGSLTFRGEGAGIYNAGTLTMVATTIQRQFTARSGSGIYNAGTLAMTGSTVRDNVIATGLAYGGGLYNAGTATITGTLFENNKASEFGGGIYNTGTLVVEGSTFSQNLVRTLAELSSGGAVYNVGSASFTNTVFSDNYAIWEGGAIFNEAVLRLETVEMVRNRAGQHAAGLLNGSWGEVTAVDLTIVGGVSGSAAAFSTAGRMTVEGCLIRANDAEYATVIDNGGTLVIERCALVENPSPLLSSTGPVTIRNATISGNRDSHGSGEADVSIVRGTATIEHSTLVHTGIGLAAVDGGLAYKNTLVFAGCAVPGAGSITSHGYNLVAGAGCPADGPHDVTVDPAMVFVRLIGPLQDNGGGTPTHALLSGSRAIDAASCVGIGGLRVTGDQRGELRPSDDPNTTDVESGCDVGAFELQFAPPVTDASPPVCGRLDVIKDDQGRLIAVETSAEDQESGIVSVAFTRLKNLDGFLNGHGPFVQGHTETFDPQTTARIVIRGERIDMTKGGTMVTRITNGAGLAAMCDPVLSTLSAEIPVAFSLEQNFPNPFNPETTIRFALPEAVHVTLVVYDAAGQEVTRLVDAPLGAGVHEARFAAGDLASGVYFVRLEAGTFSEIRQMVLLK